MAAIWHWEGGGPSLCSDGPPESQRQKIRGKCFEHDVTKRKVFRDPVHNYIHVRHQVILDLINTPEFQRLRRIKQLGVANTVFQGAEHSRFTHSLGVYEITRQICDSFKHNYPDQWDDSERLVALCAALLHDIGHGAYSHTFEHIFNTDHEAITRRILCDESTNINRILREVAPDFPQKSPASSTTLIPTPKSCK